MPAGSDLLTRELTYCDIEQICTMNIAMGSLRHLVQIIQFDG